MLPVQETEYDGYPLVTNRQGERSAADIKVTVSHDLGDRTLVVVILLAIVIGACGVVIGTNIAKQDMQGQYMRDVAAKLQINTNHTMELEKQVGIVKGTQNAD